MRSKHRAHFKRSTLGCSLAVLLLSCAPPPLGSGSGGSAGTGGSLGSGGSSGASWCAVSQILQNNCQLCHAATPLYGAPMPLVTYSDLTTTRNGSRVYDLVVQRITNTSNPMPPTSQPRMAQSDIATIQSWVQSGAPQGSQVCSGGGGGYGGTGGSAAWPSDCQQHFSVRAHGQQVVGDTSLYTVPTGGDIGNTYTCFYFKPPYPDGSNALALHGLFDQTNTKYLHHWILYGRDTPSHPAGTQSACSATEPGAYFITGWAPGGQDWPIPSDVGVNLPPAAGELALEVHYYNPNNDPGVSDGTGVEFCTAPASARPHTAGVTFTGGENICLQPLSSSTVSGDCVPQTNMGDIHILGVFPHMHRLATRQSIIINRAGGTKETLHDQPFSFGNQTFYPKDVLIHPGDTLTTTCYYTNPTSTAVHFGERTSDEMCYGFVVAWPLGALQSTDLGMVLGPILGFGQPARRCLNGASILGSCNGLSDYPPGN